MSKRLRLTPAQTRACIDSYTLYRFGHVLSPADFAKQAGVECAHVEALLAQRPISEADLSRIARAINVSVFLLSQIAGYRDTDAATRTSLDRFFLALRQEPKLKKAA
jgi:hypothetical protein